MTPEEQAIHDQVVAERDEALARIAATEGERDGFRGQLREAVHLQAFRDLAVAGGVRPDAADALYRLTGFVPEADEPDAEALAALVADGKARYPFTLAPEPTAAAPTTPAAPAKPGARPPTAPAKPLGAQRGPEAPRKGDRFKVTKAQTSDPGWMVTNWDAYQAAGKDGSLEIVD